jgi:hypothetical protein
MRMSDYFQSPYFRGADFEDVEPRTLTIKSVEQEEVGKERQKKMVVRFKGETQGLVLNKINWRTLENAYGATENWRGRPVELFGASVEFSGEMQPGIRCRIPKGGSTDILPRPSSPAPIDDDIPF